jgi:hypothetical protein
MASQGTGSMSKGAVCANRECKMFETLVPIKYGTRAICGSCGKDTILFEIDPPLPEPESITFEAEIKLPSLENYRGRSKTATSEKAQKKREKAARQYARIMSTKHLLGWKCREAARPGQLGRLFGKQVRIEVEMHHQAIDADNIKIIPDALKNICYPDDKKQWVRGVSADHVDDPKYDKPTVVVKVRFYE